jgi:putative membrane protein
MRVSICVIPLVFLCSCFHHEDATASGGQASTLSATDKAFVQDATEGNHAEIELSRVALEHASHPDVKKFAQHVIDDHTKIGDELSKLATEKMLKVDGTLSPKHNQGLSRISKLSGSEFDRQYMAAMVDDHVTTVTKFETEARAAQDQDLKSFAATNLPTLREHLEQARTLAAKVDGAGK